MTMHELLQKIPSLASFALIGAVASFLASVLYTLVAVKLAAKRREAKTEERLEEQLAAVFHGLQENSRQATQLLARLQSEVTARNNTMQEIEMKLQELRQQRTLIELTSEQRQAIEGLVRRQPSPREIFTSLDFWLGRVAPSAFFFMMGIMASWLVRR
jgi:hypothetical protein